MNVLPVTSTVADLFDWKVTSTIAAIGGVGRASLQVDNASAFVLMSFLGSTNYDAIAGDFIAEIGAGPAAARTLVSPPFVPNNFSVTIRYNSDQNMMDGAMPQACICSNGYRQGNQLPYPMIFPPMTTFDFEFVNTSRTVLTQADQATVIPLQISFGMFGYFVPIEQLKNFLLSLPAYSQQARMGGEFFNRFTEIGFSS